MVGKSILDHETVALDTDNDELVIIDQCFLRMNYITSGVSILI